MKMKDHAAALIAAIDPALPGLQNVTIGRTRYRVAPDSAKWIKKNAGKRPPSCVVNYSWTYPKYHAEAIQLYKSERNAVETITRQIETMGEDMDADAKKRAERFVYKLGEGHSLRAEQGREFDRAKGIHVATGPTGFFTVNDRESVTVLGGALKDKRGSYSRELRLSTEEVEDLKARGYILRMEGKPATL